ncbi:MAG TPA: TonB-dependent receptor [Steroidobacteraceae bacterium]|nr:TonB-dependent receptor [Steroidobacteraceae bacterium]
MIKRAIQFAGAVVVVCALSEAVLAADAVPRKAGEPPPAAESGQIEEILVTAQRRPEDIQKSSISIEALGTADLVRNGVSEARDLTTVAPSLTIAQNGAFTQTNVRGAGDVATNALAQPAVSYSVDGVVSGQSVGISASMFDLARVEILKGPQGTLYGRNATGGAVNIITNRPTHAREGYVTGEFGNYSSRQVTGAVNVPLSAAWAVRGAANFVDRHGYLSDGTDDDVRRSGRVQVLWEPNERANLRLNAEYSHTGGKGGGTVLLPRQGGTGPWTGLSDPVNNAALAAGSLGLHVPVANDNFVDLNQWSLSAEANVELGNVATLTIIPAYRNLKMRQRTYNYSARADYDPQDTDQFTLEARLGHQTDALKWVVGAFYYDSSTSFALSTKALADPVFLPVFYVTADIDTTNRSYAAFGETTYSVTDAFRVIGGVRYTLDKVKMSGSLIDNGAVPNPDSPYPQAGDDDFRSFTWRGGIEYDVAPRSMLFATASKGYKSGGFFYVPGGDENKFKPESLLAFEIGLRNRFLDDRLQVNLETFYYKYTNQQIPSPGFTPTGNIAYNTRNAGSSKPRGAEASVVFKPTRAGTLSASLAYTRARYDDFKIEFPAPLIATLRSGAPCKVPSAPTISNGLPVFLVDCSGAPLARTPEWTGSLAYEHVFTIGASSDLTVNVDGTWATSRYLSSDAYPIESKTAGYTLWNASITSNIGGTGLSISGFVRNIGNRAVYQGGIIDIINGFPALLGVPGTPTFYEATVGAPRTYGIRATYRF